MRYKLASGIEIRTENAAKPASQPSAFVLGILADLPHTPSTFDYGCGKLRYQAAIMGTTDTLTLVDSEIQISRIQTLRNTKTSIRTICKHSNRVHVENDVEFKKNAMRFDRGFCINVLSVIPSYRGRRQVLDTIRRKLNERGECLFVVQYRNSDFIRMKKLPNAKPLIDGFLVDSLRGHSFYGLISADGLEKSLKRAGFKVRETKLNDGSAYIWATPS